jgi:hypothetical protein
MDSGQTTNLGVAVACLLPALGAGWKASGLRGDIGSRWNDRVNIAHAGLHERAIAELTQLQIEIGELLGGAVGAFNPATVWADPGPIVKRANRCAQILRTRDRLQARLMRHRHNGSLLMPVVAVYVVGWIGVTLFTTRLFDWHWTRLHSVKTAGLWACGAAIVAGIIVVGVYAYYESKLAEAEELTSG